MGTYDIEALISAAERTRQDAQARYSGFTVGAAILASSGKVFTGCNIENPSVMLTTCAERIALYKALSEGEKDFTAIAVVSSSEKPCFPCGVCRQLLFEFAPNIAVYLATEHAVYRYGIAELLPHPFLKDE